MSRYQPLADFLSAKKSDGWNATFADIEQVLGFSLPPSALQYQAWWANQAGGHSQTHGWRSVGWKTSGLDLKRKHVRFERESNGGRSSGGFAAAPTPLTPLIGENDIERLVDEARVLTGIADTQALQAEAFRALIAREAAVRLARLGGTMPDFTAPDRARRG